MESFDRPRLALPDMREAGPGELLARRQRVARHARPECLRAALGVAGLGCRGLRERNEQRRDAE